MASLAAQRLGQTVTAQNGMKMTIIAYRQCKDIDVQFEDGAIVYHKTYRLFENGGLRHPSHALHFFKTKEKRIGEARKNNNGQTMTIIAYRSARDIDIQFDNGSILEHKAYESFKKGTIRCPGITDMRYELLKEKRTGETCLALNGMMMRIIKYRNADDIDVEFEDGTIVKHTTISVFLHGTIANPNFNKEQKEKRFQSHIGETNMATNGQIIKIIRYDGFHDIDVEFEDGTIVYHKRYDFFQKGFIINPNVKTTEPKVSHKNNNGFKRELRVGQTNVARNGLMMTIEEYRSATDLDVRFENGILVTHKAYKEFKAGCIGCPGIGRKQNKTHLHEKHISNQGQMMEIIDYKNLSDITVQFEDGTIIYHKHYNSFVKGGIRNPNAEYTETSHPDVGKTTQAKNGMMMTIIAYRGVNDIDVQFEDGYVAQHKQMHNFKLGTIRNPRVPKKKLNRIGNETISSTGLNMKITSAKSDQDCNIEFETGYIAKHKHYANFYRGRIGHQFPWHITDNVTMIKPAYVHDNIGNFYCTCSKCGMSDIMTVSEMKQHVCQPSQL